MAYRVTTTEVRYRFRTLTSTDISDDILNSLGYIPLTEALINVILSNNGIEYDSLTADQKTLVKGAEIARTCQMILQDYPEDGWETGPIKYRPQGANSRDSLNARLDGEWKHYLTLIGCSTDDIFVSSSGGDDYVPDGTDDTNIDFVDEDSDTWSLWS